MTIWSDNADYKEYSYLFNIPFLQKREFSMCTQLRRNFPKTGDGVCVNKPIAQEHMNKINKDSVPVKTHFYAIGFEYIREHYTRCHFFVNSDIGIPAFL